MPSLIVLFKNPSGAHFFHFSLLIYLASSSSRPPIASRQAPNFLAPGHCRNPMPPLGCLRPSSSQPPTSFHQTLRHPSPIVAIKIPHPLRLPQAIVFPGPSFLPTELPHLPPSRCRHQTPMHPLCHRPLFAPSYDLQPSYFTPMFHWPLCIPLHATTIELSMLCQPSCILFYALPPSRSCCVSSITYSQPLNGSKLVEILYFGPQNKLGQIKNFLLRKDFVRTYFPIHEKIGKQQ